MTLKDIGKQRAGRLTGGVRVNHINLCTRRLQITQVGSECRFELLGDDFKLIDFSEKPFKFRKDKRVRRQQTNGEFRRHSFRSHCS